MFTDKSRYKNVTQYEVTDQRGRTVKVVAAPAAPLQSIKGFHLLKQGQRTDHLHKSIHLNPLVILYWGWQFLIVR